MIKVWSRFIHLMENAAMSGISKPQITPTELLGYALEVEQATETHVMFMLSPDPYGGPQPAWRVSCELFPKEPYFPGEDSYKMTHTWPTSTHKTLLGLLYWLMLGCDNELTAARTLADLGASAPADEPAAN